MFQAVMRTYNKDPGASLKGLPTLPKSGQFEFQNKCDSKEYNPLDEIRIHTDININEEQNTLPQVEVNKCRRNDEIRKSLFSPPPNNN